MSLDSVGSFFFIQCILLLCALLGCEWKCSPSDAAMASIACSTVLIARSPTTMYLFFSYSSRAASLFSRAALVWTSMSLMMVAFSSCL